MNKTTSWTIVEIYGFYNRNFFLKEVVMSSFFYKCHTTWNLMEKAQFKLELLKIFLIFNIAGKGMIQVFYVFSFC